MASGLRWDRPHRDPTTRTRYRPDEVGSEVIIARYPGTCVRCGQGFEAEALIQRNFDHGAKVQGKKVYNHLECTSKASDAP